jgi:cell division protein FtsB
MQYWHTQENPTSELGAFRDYRPRARTAPGHPSVVASGGSVGPFLRKFYRHQVIVSPPVQRFFLCLILAGVIYAFVLGDGGAIRIVMLRNERAEMERKIAELERNAALLEKEIALLESDPFFIEKTGRERYGYIRPGEKVYKIVPTEASPR